MSDYDRYIKNSVFVVILSFFPVSLFSAIINVPSDRPTIQAGIDAAVNGDTVLVAPGTYTENVDFHGKSVVLMSKGGSEVTFLQPEFSYNPTLTISNFEAPAISGFTFRSAGQSGAINIIGGADIFGNVFINNVLAVEVNGGGPYIHHNLFFHNSSWGTLDLYDYAAVINNTFDSNPWGIFLGNGIQEEPYVINNIISNTDYPIYGVIFDTPIYFANNDIWNWDWLPPSTIPYNFTFDPTNIFLDPLYVDADNHDYHLQVNSPCIDAGQGSPDSDGTPPDLGTFPRIFVLPYAKDLNYIPTTIDHFTTSLTPSFTWTYFDIGQTTQAQYQIQVGTDDDWGEAEMWDSGPVSSGGFSANYDGLPLFDHTNYYLRIRLHNGTDWGEWIPDWFFTHTEPRVIHIPEEFLSIQDGIEASYHGDTILVAPGRYYDNLDYLGRTIAVISEKGPRDTHIRPSNITRSIVRMVNGEGAGTVLKGFTIKAGGDVTTVQCGQNTDPIIENNIFYDNISGVIDPLAVIKAESHAVIRYNLFYNNGGICSIWAEEDAEIINNTIVSNERGVYSSNGQATLLNNIITGNDYFGVYGYFHINDYNNVWNNGVSINQGPHGISADPLFVDVFHNNYNLRQASPCVDAGNPDPVYDDINGTRNDIGAYPFLFCGDSNLDNVVSVGDIVMLINYYFGGGPPPALLENSDFSCDEAINLVDIILLNSFVLSNGSIHCCD